MTSILRIVPSEAERAAGLLSAQTIERASRSFRDDGALIIEDIIDATIVADARRKFSESYSRYLDSRNHDDALHDQRLMITVDLSPPFGDAQLFANQYLLPVLNSALGNDFVIGAFGVFCAWPSAGAQDRHCDGGILFPSSPLNWQLPATAVNVVIPLIEMNEIHGTTALWPGTHRDWARSFAVRNFAQKNDSPDGKIEPVVRAGVLYALGLSFGAWRNCQSRSHTAPNLVCELLPALVFGSGKLRK